MKLSKKELSLIYLTENDQNRIDLNGVKYLLDAERKNLMHANKFEKSEILQRIAIYEKLLKKA